MPSSESDNFAPTITDTLVPVPDERREEEDEEREEEEQEKEEPDEKERENIESKYNSEGTITII